MIAQAVQGTHSEAGSGSKLPFDILYCIFSQYSENETPESPLETLLLVCRFWKEAALEHRVIWSRFKIEIESKKDAIQWKERIDRRLERSGPHSPIFFRLHQKPVFPDHHNPIAAEVVKLVDAVTGSSGSLCARWKEIDLDLHNVYFNSQDKCFTYPTPILTSLRLKKMALLNARERVSSSDYAFFPSAPKLETFVVSECEMIIFPDITNVTSLELHHSGSSDNFAGCINDLSVLAKAERLEHLTLDYYHGPVPYNLPRVLPFLTSFCVGAGELTTNIGDPELPTLRHLSVELTAENVTLLLKLHGIPFHQLKTLEIILDPLDPYIEDEFWEEYQNACLALLKKCQNVAKILCNSSSIALICMVLKEDSKGEFVLFGDGVYIIVIDREQIIRVTSDRSERGKLL